MAQHSHFRPARGGITGTIVIENWGTATVRVEYPFELVAVILFFCVSVFICRYKKLFFVL